MTVHSKGTGRQSLCSFLDFLFLEYVSVEYSPSLELCVHRLKKALRLSGPVASLI